MPHAAAKRTARRVRPVRATDRYLLGLDDDELEDLQRGICRESVALKCWQLLKWRREAHRNDARAQLERRGN